MSSNCNFDTPAREERGVRCEGGRVRRAKGVKNEAWFEALGGEVLSRFMDGVFSWSLSGAFCKISRRRFDGVLKLFGYIGFSVLRGCFDGVGAAGERRSKIPRTRPFFCGVGPMDLRCAVGVLYVERGAS